MRSITRRLITFVFVIIGYFCYSSWIDWLINTRRNTNLVQILSPFKFIILGMLFAAIVPTFKSIFMTSIIGIYNYRKNKTNFLLYDYEKLRAILVSLKINIKNNNLVLIKRELLKYSKCPVQPEFANTLVFDLTRTALTEGDFRIYTEAIEHVISSVDEIYNDERLAIETSNKKEAFFFDFRRGYEMVSKGSKYNLKYYRILYSYSKAKFETGWKIFSLHMFKFYLYLIYYGFGITTLLAIIIFPVLKIYVNFDLSQWGSILFISANVFVAIVLHFIKIISINKNFYSWKYLLLPAIVYYMLIILISINVCCIIWTMPNINDKVPSRFLFNESDSKAILLSGPLPYLLSLAYLILSTALLLYVIATLMDAFKALGLSYILIIEGIVVPLLLWIVVSFFKFYFYNLSINGNIGIEDNNKIVGLIVLTLFVYWIINWIIGNFMSVVVKNKRNQKQQILEK